MSQACPSCGAQRGHFHDCPVGGLKVAPAPALVPVSEPTELPRWTPLVALAVMGLVALTPLRVALQLFFGMWLHELGHATTAWLCGAFAVPLPWLTLGGHGRDAWFSALEFAALGFWVWRVRAQWRWAAACAAVLVVGLLLPLRTMEQWVVFGGDGGALVWGAALMAAARLPAHWRVSRGGLRWGYVVIGAGAFASVFSQWLRAWRDPEEIPFGRIEGVGLSDPSRLVDVHGWSEGRMVHSYLALGGVLLVLLVLREWRTR